VNCTGKGKERRIAKFGVEVSMVLPHESGVEYSARSFPGNLGDGHTLAGKTEQTTNLLQDLE
jgi:hypothetical protein